MSWKTARYCICTCYFNSRLNVMHGTLQAAVRRRYSINAELKSGIFLREIARLLSRSVSSISREIKRNMGLRGYRPKQAQDKAKKDAILRQANLAHFPLVLLPTCWVINGRQNKFMALYRQKAGYAFWKC